MAAVPFKYWAFISYSHQDQHWAEWLMRRLEHYRLPRALVGRASRDGALPPRLFPVFRDRDELASGSELGPEIQAALRASRYLIVVCSPRSASSHWVNAEVEFYKRLGREDRVLCLIVDGEPGSGDARECFAPALRQRISSDGRVSGQLAEPIAADARSHGDGRDPALLKLIAGLLGVGYDELRQRDLLARNRRLAVIAGLSILVAAITVMLAVTAYLARQTAEHSRQQAEDLIGFMLGDLRAKLEPVGRLDVLDAVDERAMQYFADAERSGQTDATLAARAKALRQIGEIRTQQGRLAEAEQSFRAALLLDRGLAQRQPQQAQAIFNLGQSQYWTGYAAWLSADFAGAETHFLAYRDSAQRLLQLQPAKAEWLQELGYAESNLGTLTEARGQLPSALSHFQAARDITKTLVQTDPDNTEYQLNHAESLAWTAAVLQKLDRNDEARSLLEQQVQLLQQLVARHAQDMSLKYRHTLSLLLLLDLQADTGELSGFRARSQAALAQSQALADRDPANLDWLEALHKSHALLSVGYEFSQQLQPAVQQARTAMALAARVHQSDPLQMRWWRNYIRASNRLAELQLRLGRNDDAQATLRGVALPDIAIPTATADDLEVAVDHLLLRLELARRTAQALPDALQAALNRLLPALEQRAPAMAAAATLRRAVMQNPATRVNTLQADLPHCGIARLRLQGFLDRNKVIGELPVCAAIKPAKQIQEHH